MATTHATRTAFGLAINACDDARRFNMQRALNQGGEGFSGRSFDRTGATCETCLLVVTRGPSVLPMPAVVQGPPVQSKILGQIVEQMRQNPRYRGWIDEPEWAHESYR